MLPRDVHPHALPLTLSTPLATAIISETPSEAQRRLAERTTDSDAGKATKTRKEDDADGKDEAPVVYAYADVAALLAGEARGGDKRAIASFAARPVTELP